MNEPVKELIEFDLVERMKLRSRKTGFYIDKNNENKEPFMDIIIPKDVVVRVYLNSN